MNQNRQQWQPESYVKHAGLTAPHKYAKKGAEIDKFSHKSICSWIQP
jgi:hypothetical protein